MEQVKDLSQDNIYSAYKFWAPIYDRVYGLLFSWGRRAAVGEANKFSGALLEVGVGTGIALPEYSKRLQITGIDLSEDMLREAQKRVERDGLENVLSLQAMDASQLTFADDSFDVAVSMFVVTIAPDPEGVFREMIRVVRPGGRIILLNHFRQGTGITGLFERLTAKHVARYGLRPDFDKRRVIDLPGTRLVQEYTTAPVDFYTVLEFEVL